MARTPKRQVNQNFPAKAEATMDIKAINTFLSALGVRSKRWISAPLAEIGKLLEMALFLSNLGFGHFFTTT